MAIKTRLLAGAAAGAHACAGLSTGDSLLSVLHFPPVVSTLAHGEPLTGTVTNGLPVDLLSEFSIAPGENERQTLTLTGGAANDTFKLTFNGHASAVVTIPFGGYTNVTPALIKAALLTISDFRNQDSDIEVTDGAGATWVIDFDKNYRMTDMGAITVTSKTGAADGSVAESNKGTVAQLDNTAGTNTTGGKLLVLWDDLTF